MAGSRFGAIPDALDNQKSVRNLCNSCFSVAAALFKLSNDVCESSREEGRGGGEQRCDADEAQGLEGG